MSEATASAAVSAAAPAVVIFGAAVRPDGSPSNALRRRVEAAFAFAQAHPEALFVPTGGVGRHGPAEALVMAGLLRAAGVPGARIRIEPTAGDTLASVRAVRRLLDGWPGPVWVATDAYHMPRCVLLMRLAGLRARACPPPPGPASRRLWRRWRWRLREVPAVPYDAVLMLWHRAARRL
jgi:uncharacterized SAM-binding protein YcdF (DUF218 family)